MLETYGMTESTGGVCSSFPWDNEANNTVGGPIPAIKIKLVDLPEYGYLSSNKIPAGEIYIKGSTVFKGYFKHAQEYN